MTPGRAERRETGTGRAERHALTAGDPYFLVDALPAAGPYTLDGPEGRHAATVRRMRAGESLVLTDGAGRLAAAVIVAAGRSSVELTVHEMVELTPPSVRVTLVQALPKGERSDLAVDLATEAGVDALVPWSASRCVARWTADKAVKGVEKWRTVAREAAKQSRRATVPRVSELVDTAAVAALIGHADGALVLHEAGSMPIARATLPTSGELLLIVGPEGGVSPEELSAFRAAGAQVVRLGHEVLRTSTAAAVALGALGVLTGRWADRDSGGTR